MYSEGATRGHRQLSTGTVVIGEEGENTWLRALGWPESQVQEHRPCFGGRANLDYGNVVSERRKA